MWVYQKSVQGTASQWKDSEQSSLWCEKSTQQTSHWARGVCLILQPAWQKWDQTRGGGGQPLWIPC